MTRRPAVVAVDASSAVTGGAVTYLREILPRFMDDTRLELGPVLLREESNAASELANNVDHPLLLPGRGSARTGRWRGAIREAGTEVVYCPTEVSAISYPVPLVLAIRNPLLDPNNLYEMPIARRAKVGVQKILARRCLRGARSVIAVSHYAAEIGVKHLGLERSDITVVHHGGPGGRPPAVESGPISEFLYVSHANPYKNMHRLVEAFSRVPAAARLRIVGGSGAGRYMREVQRLAQRLGASERVVFSGELQGAALSKAYELAECFVWPSYAETFGHPIVEALSHGLPVLAADAPCNHEILGGRAAYFNPFDVGDIAAVIGDAVRIGVTGGELPREYSWDACAIETGSVLVRSCGSFR